MAKYDEIGDLGLNAYSGFIEKASQANLTYPACIPHFNRIFRQFPPVAIIRTVLSMWTAEQEIVVTLPESKNGRELAKPTDADKKAQDFYWSILDELEGGIDKWAVKANTTVPFYGWGYWEVVPGVRNQSWRPPNDDPWRSSSNDGLIGIRRIAWRDYSSFYRWDLEDNTGRVLGLEQQKQLGGIVTIPIDRGLHIGQRLDGRQSDFGPTLAPFQQRLDCRCLVAP